MLTNRRWKIWQTITIGTHKTTRSLWDEVVRRNSTQNRIYRDSFKRIKVSPVKKTLNLVKLTAADFGFRDIRDSRRAKESSKAWSNNRRDSCTQLLEPGATYHFRQLYKRALDSGLKLCPQEVALQLLLQPSEYLEVPEWHDGINIAMKPRGVRCLSYEGDPYIEDKVFTVDGGCISETYALGSFWRTGDPYWIFVLPRRLTS